MSLSNIETAKIALFPGAAERIERELDPIMHYALQNRARTVASLRDNLYFSAVVTTVVLTFNVRTDKTSLKYISGALAVLSGYLTTGVARELYDTTVEFRDRLTRL